MQTRKMASTDVLILNYELLSTVSSQQPEAFLLIWHHHCVWHFTVNQRIFQPQGVGILSRMKEYYSKYSLTL